MPTEIIPFDSIFKQEYMVVEEKRENLSLFPHTEQLPVIHRAVDLEFKSKMPARSARVDQRASGFEKIVLSYLATTFSALINCNRSDKLLLFPLLDPNLVTRIAVVQQIIEHTPKGPLHRFKFYAGPDLFIEIYLSGRRLAFTDHAIEQFKSRVPGLLGACLHSLLLEVFAEPYVALACNDWCAFVLPFGDSLFALPFDEVDGTFIILTTLAIHEIFSLQRTLPVHTFNLHYDMPFRPPSYRHWCPMQVVAALFRRWERKAPFNLPGDEGHVFHWGETAYKMKDFVLREGYEPGSTILFSDNICGPAAHILKAGQSEPRINESAVLKTTIPGVDWDKKFLELQRMTYSKNAKI